MLTETPSTTTNHTTSSLLHRHNTIDPIERPPPFESCALFEPIQVTTSSTSPTDWKAPPPQVAVSRSVTKESLLEEVVVGREDQQQDPQADEDDAYYGIDAPPLFSSEYYFRITPPPPSSGGTSVGRESPLLFAASFDQTEAADAAVTALDESNIAPSPQTIVTLPSVSIMSQQPPKVPAPPPNPIQSSTTTTLTVKPVVSTTTTSSSSSGPPKPPSLIHHPPVPPPPRQKQPQASATTNSNNTPSTPPSPTSENTGRWTAEEHRLFLQGLEEHGKGWKKIASLIQTRTVVQIRTHAQKYFQKLAKARANGEPTPSSVGGLGLGEDDKGVVGGGCVSMRTVPNYCNMSVGRDEASVAAQAGQVGTGSGNTSMSSSRKRSRNTGGGTKRRAIGSVVRSSVREGRTYKRQKGVEMKNKNNAKQTQQGGGAGGNAKQQQISTTIPNPLPAISNVLYPYVMAPPPVLGGMLDAEGKKKGTRGRQQLVKTATHGTLPMHALEDAVFRLLTPAPGATGHSAAHAPQQQQQPPPQNSSIVDPLAPNPVKITAPHPQAAASGVPNSSPTCVTDMSGFPSWVDAKNPPTWYNNGEDIDKLLEDAEDLNWLCDTGDLEETYPPAVAATAAAVSNEPSVDLEPTPVHVHPYDYAAYDPNNASLDPIESMDPTPVNNPVTHPSVESLSFLVDSPKDGIDEMTTLLEEQPEDHLAYSASQTEIVDDTQELPGVESQHHLMSFPDLDMGDEEAFVGALLDTSKESALSFTKWGSQNGVAELGEEGL